MKLGVTVSAYAAKFGPIVFRDPDIVKSIETIKKLGYDGVDLYMNRRSDEEIETLRCKFEENKLEVASYVPIFLSEGGLNLSCRDSEKREKYIQELEEQIGKAQRIGTKRIPIGFSRGAKAEDENIFDNLARLASTLDELCAFAEVKDITLCLEPINRYEINTLNTVEQSLEFIEKYHLDKLGLLLDLFHMNIEDTSIEGAILQAGNKIAHVHAPDSNRLAAGSGHLNYENILKALDATGYSGYLVLEAFPMPDAISCASMNASFIRQKLAELEVSPI